MVCETLEAMNSTRIVIAHRLSTIIKCDRIIVLDGGTVVEQGTYEELMDNKGLFYELASRQIA
jgi:ATP-binding cassette subfamily C protein